MTQEEFKEILAEHKKWVLSEGGKPADLRGAYFRGADLQGAYLQGADLREAYLRDADLREADLRDAYLRGADLRGADLREADLQGADLKGAYLQGADLRGAKISFTSHDLISEILKRSAGDNIARLKLAGFVLLKREWCWAEFLAMKDGCKKWALDELRKWTYEGDNAPEILHKGKAK